MSPSDTKERKVTGANSVTVMVEEKLGSRVVKHAVTVRRGETLPDGLADGEYERIEKAGAFNNTTHGERRANLQRRARIARAQAAASQAVAAEETRAPLPTNANTEPPPPIDDPDVVVNPKGDRLPVESLTGGGADADADALNGFDIDNFDPEDQDDFDGMVAVLKRQGNVAETVEFIEGRPEGERDAWLDAEKEGKNRDGVVSHFDSDGE